MKTDYKAGRAAVADAVAAALRTDLPSFTGGVLLGCSELAARYRVSVPTMRSALRLLAAQGLVTLYPRKRALIAGVPRIVPTARASPVERVRQISLERISSGDLRVGDSLPKTATVARECRVSNSSVVEAFGCLCAQNAVHRVGKRYVVGGAEPSTATVCQSAGPIIAVLVRSRQHWKGLCTEIRTEQFGHQFMAEAQRHRTRLVALEMSSPQGADSETVRAAALDRLRAYEGSLAGTLVAAGTSDVPDLDEWVRALLTLRRPVAWFDRYGEGAEGMDVSAVGSGRGRRGLFSRLHFDERAGVRTALEYLAAMGHRRTAYPMTEQGGWQHSRASLLAGEAPGAGVEVLAYTVFRIDEWRAPRESGLAEALEWIVDSGPGPAQTALRWAVARRGELVRQFGTGLDSVWESSRFNGLAAVSLARFEDQDRMEQDLVDTVGAVWSALSLYRLLRHGGITALIAPNDTMARAQHLHWCDDLRIGVPRDLSVMSFDNAQRFECAPPTSIDFGFEWLGYAAYHVLAGDVPIGRDRKGNVTPCPSVADRGSVSRLTGRG